MGFLLLMLIKHPEACGGVRAHQPRGFIWIRIRSGLKSAASPPRASRATLTFCFGPRYKLRRESTLPKAPQNTSQAVEFSGVG